MMSLEVTSKTRSIIIVNLAQLFYEGPARLSEPFQASGTKGGFKWVPPTLASGEKFCLIKDYRFFIFVH
jgi:hypothetical protein